MKADEMHDTSEDLKRRAAARALLSNANRPPNLLVVFYDAPPRDAEGHPTGDPGPRDSVRAGVPGAELTREPNEPYDDFERRVWDSLPAAGGAFGVMWPVEPERKAEGAVR